MSAAPARAQLTAGLSVDSDYRLRAHSITDGEPAANLELGYDDPSGIYADLNATARLDGRLGVAAVQGVLGYARPVTPVWAIDLGALRMQFTPQSSARRDTGYTEVYFGLTSRHLSTRAYYSPDYFAKGVSTLYTEIAGGVEPVASWRLNGHVGRLTYLGASASYRRKDQYDWRVGAAHDVGRIELHVALSGGGPSPDYYDHAERSRTAFVVGARISL